MSHFGEEEKKFKHPPSQNLEGQASIVIMRKYLSSRINICKHTDARQMRADNVICLFFPTGLLKEFCFSSDTSVQNTKLSGAFTQTDTKNKLDVYFMVNIAGFTVIH